MEWKEGDQYTSGLNKNHDFVCVCVCVCWFSNQFVCVCVCVNVSAIVSWWNSFETAFISVKRSELGTENIRHDIMCNTWWIQNGFSPNALRLEKWLDCYTHTGTHTETYWHILTHTHTLTHAHTRSHTSLHQKIVNSGPIVSMWHCLTVVN